ncbi:MAG: LysM peptidoglycan-binding domain-containing protein [Planctomycetales bacterium]|nr:LysM peptidoglycan-binding domain-containing protein [Planctomycetales bacterium]
MTSAGSLGAVWKLGLAVVTVGVVAGGFLWQRNGESLEPEEKQPTIADGAAADGGAVADADGVEAATYSEETGLATRDGSVGLDGIARAATGGDGGRQFGQDDASAVNRIPLGDGESGISRRQLGEIPQSEPAALAEPPSFEVADQGVPALGASGAGDEFPSDSQRLPRNEQEADLSVQRSPQRNGATPDSPAFNSPDQSSPDGRRQLQWAPSSSPAIEQAPFAAGGGDAVTRRGLDGEVAGGTLPRSFDSSEPAQPIAEEGGSPIGLGTSKSEGTAPAVHAVESGDSYWTISQRHYGTAQYFQALAEYNRRRIPDPRLMRPGMKVVVPSRELLESRYASLLPRSVEAAGEPTQTVGFQIDPNGNPVYSVGPKDTLTAIAQMHLGRRSRWIQIFRMNRDQLPSPHKLKPGTVLRMPADAARLQVARGAGLRR